MPVSRRRNARPVSAPPRKPSFSEHLIGLLRTTGGKIAAAVALLATLGSLYGTANGVRGLYFQTFPEIHVAGSTPGRPFELPFTVKNPSGWFAMRAVKWSCSVDLDAAGLRLKDVREIRGGNVEIGPTETKNFDCRIKFDNAQIVRLEVTTEVNYKTLFVPRGPAKAHFTWRNDRWIEGELN